MGTFSVFVVGVDGVDDDVFVFVFAFVSSVGFSPVFDFNVSSVFPARRVYEYCVRVLCAACVCGCA